MDAKFIKSPNYSSGRKNYTPVGIVIHIMEGTLDGTDSWFQNTNSKVSAHYGIGKNGDLHQYVKEEDTAWHAGRINNPTWKLIKKAEGEANSYINPNYYTIGIEHEGGEQTDWTEDMYKTSSALISIISKKWNIPLDRDHIIGHHEIYSLKDCPGNKVDFTKLIQMASGNSINPPENNNYKKFFVFGKATTQDYLNIRSGPDTNHSIIATVSPNIQLAFDGFIENGENIYGNSKWHFTNEGNWYWSGVVK